MKIFVRWVLALTAFCLCTGFSGSPRIEYVLTPVFENRALTAVQVDITFHGGHGGETPLQLPSEWGGQQQLWRGIADLQAISGATMSDGADAWHRVLHHRPDAAIHVRYRVVQDWPGEPRAERGNEYRPVIQPTYFHLIGNAFIVEPGVDDATPVHVSVSGLPRGWSFASDLQHPGLVLAHVMQSVVVAGDYRIVRGADPNIRVALRGEWRFTDADFATQVNTIIGAERAFWGDRSTPYLVTVTHISAPDAGWTSIGGTGLDDAFAFFATPNAELPVIARTLAHEGIHTWIPALVGGMPDQDEAAGYWLSEGFTDFYTGRIMVRGGGWTPVEFAADLNDMLRAYAQSPVRTQPNTRVIADFWSNPDVQHLPYQRGRLLATRWDAQLRALHHDRNLDDVMFEMRRRAQHGDAHHAAELFQIVMREQGVDVSADITQFVEHGAPILLDENIFAPCGRIVTRDVPLFSRGFDIEATQANHNVISGVDPALPAYAAGMRDGMVLIRRDRGTIGDSGHEIAYVVRDGASERTIAYMPRGHGAYTLQEFVLDSLSGDAVARCRALLAGN